ncbi:unnamed protein product [Ectocarpus sp. CCAP 1310/34]|nr:unnamed protein product [Ectocarpus sp. CCAP 1310/34]
MGRGDKDRYSSRDERGSSRERDGGGRGERGYGGRDRGNKDDDRGGRDRDRDRDRDSSRKHGRHDRASSRDHGAKDREGGSSKRKESRNKVNMGYDDDEEYDGGGGYGRNRSESPPKVVDVEKIKPNTEENKGEISMSVEETNRVRAMLGLKPLNVGRSASGKPTEEEIAVENMRLKREEEEQARELKELEARLQKARTKRQLNEKLKGDTLGEVKPGDEEVVSAADWVNRSRKKAVAMEEERLLARQRERILEEQEMELANGGGDGNGRRKAAYGAENLAGLKVTHGAASFEAGDSVILTLKDQGLLDEDEHGRVTGLKDAEDELENVHMKEAERRMELDKEAIRAKRGAYQAYDDEEFEGEIGPGAKRKVLSHYDEAKKEGPRLTLGQGGTARDAAATDGGGGGGKKVLESLKVDVKDASEYYTTEEMAKFKKPKKMRKKKLRKREEAGASSSLGLEAALHDSSRNGSSGANAAANGARNAPSSSSGGGSAAANGGGDHGSRASRAARIAASEKADRGDDKRKRFDTALARAGERASEKLADSFAKPPPPPPPSAPPATEPEVFAEELDSDLGVSLARARRLAQMKDKAKARKSRDIGEAVRDAMARKKVKTEASEEGPKAEDDGRAGGGGGGSAMAVASGGGGVSVKEELGGDGGMVFTSTTEFTSRLEATLEERKRDSIKAAEKTRVKEELEAKKAKPGKQHGKDDAMDVDAVKGEGDVKKEAEDEVAKTKAKRSRWTTKKENGDDEEEEPDVDEIEAMLEGAEEDSDDDEQMGFLHKQPLAKNGMAATLALLRPSGVLNEKFHRSGRAKDARKHHGEAEETREDRESGAKLEYRDEWGREITRKEAFRNLCYKFHGYGSGKKKQEKRLKMVEEEKKKERAMDLQRLKTLQQTQEITKQAFVVVQGGSHVGAALPPPPPSLDLKKKAQEKAKAAKMKSGTTPAPG